MNLRVGGDPEFEGEKRADLETTFSEAIRYAIRNGAKVIACTIYPIRDAEGAVEACFCINLVGTLLRTAQAAHGGQAQQADRAQHDRTNCI